jgi:histidyl-tRNA synthetase
MVVPRADPPVGTRGRPFRDLFFSGIVGRSQVPGLAIVLENGRREIEAPFFEKTALFEDAGERAVQSGRRGLKAIESLLN